MKLLLAIAIARSQASTPDVHMQALRSSTGIAIQPSLDPVSDKKFMTQDYPDDLRPGIHHFRRYDWDHPYPIVQEDKQYDTDYVKDENNDNGEWHAQTRYDTLRSQIAKQKAKVDDYKRRIESMGGDIDAIEAEEAGLEAQAKDAESKADAKKKAADDAKNKAASTGNQEGAAEGKTKEEMEQLAKCEEELKRVEEELKKLLKNSGASIGDAEKAELELKKAAMEAELKQMSEAQLEAKLAEEYAEYLRAKKEYEKILADTEETEKALDAAAERLRKFRNAEDKDGGVYPVGFHGQHSFANRFASVSLLAIASGCVASLVV